MNTDFETTDLYLAAFLRSRGCRLAETSGTPQVTFRLEADGDIDAIVSEYFNDGPAPIQAYLQNLKALRSLCLSKNGSGRKG